MGYGVGGNCMDKKISCEKEYHLKKISIKKNVGWTKFLWTKKI